LREGWSLAALQVLAGQLGFQHYLNLEEAIIDDSPVVGDVVGHLGFFTMVTTILIAACLTLVVCEPDEESFWNRPEVQTALALTSLSSRPFTLQFCRDFGYPRGSSI